MEILNVVTGFVLFAGLRSDLNSHYFWFYFLISGSLVVDKNNNTSYTMIGNRRWYVLTKTEIFQYLMKYEKDTTVESDSKQKMMSWWNGTESGSTSTKRIFLNRTMSQWNEVLNNLCVVPVRRTLPERTSSYLSPHDHNNGYCLLWFEFNNVATFY